MRSRVGSGSVALVTGSSSGFGLLCCLELARRGLRVFATMRALERSERLDRAMAEAGLSCEKVQLDVTDPESIRDAVATVESRCDGVDVLVNNAGFAMAGFFEDVAMDELREQFDTNFFGLAAVIQAVLPRMRQRRHGRIINISSLGARVANPGFTAYVASKFAVEGLSESLRHELMPHGIYVVLIEPGMYRTEIFGRNRRLAAAAFTSESPNYQVSSALKQILETRLAQSKADPREVARVVAAAATADRPHLRYLVGTDAHVLTAVNKVLPFSLWERLIRRMFGLS